VSSVDVTRPPITTVASGRWTSARRWWRAPSARRPNEATIAVMSTGPQADERSRAGGLGGRDPLALALRM